MKRIGWCILAGCLFIAAAIVLRVPRARMAPGVSMVRTYDVGDLIDAPLSVRQDLPTLVVPASDFGPPPVFGGGGGGLFGGGGSRGTPPDASEERLNELVELVRRGINPSSWSPGRASVTHFGRYLVVVQTPENQQLVGELLEDLRAHPPRQVRLEVVWAMLDPQAIARVTVASGAGEHSPATLIDLESLQKLDGAIAWRGQATCVSGQRVRISCGQTHTVPTEIDAVITNNDAGFTSKSQQLLDGATVQITASLSPDGKNVKLDVHSEVTRWHGAPSTAPIEIPVPISPLSDMAGKTVKIDRLNLGVQSLVTATRGPSGAAILMGGTSDPDAPAGDSRQLYLIIRASQATTSQRRQ
jgi:hypothetical protein